MATISFENACKISSEYCCSIKGNIMEEFSSLIMLHKNTTNSRMYCKNYKYDMDRNLVQEKSNF